MRISNNLYFQRSVAAMTNQQSELHKTDIQLASGKKILTAADDPAAAARILGLNKAIDTVDQYQSNIERATMRLEHEESAVSSVTNLLQKANELAVQGNNDVLAPVDREIVAIEVHHLIGELMGLANTKDSEGEYLFSGFQTKTKPFDQLSAGSFTYSGDQGQRSLQVSASREITDGDNGFDMFVDVATGPYASVTGVVAASLAALNDGDITINGYSIGALPVAADAAERAAQIIDAVNAVSETAHVYAELTGTDTVTLSSSAGDIVVSTVADTGLNTQITAASPQASVTGVPVSGAAIGAGDLIINGVSIGAAAGGAATIVAAINAESSTTNVTATIANPPASDAITLTSSQGRVDIVSAAPGATGLTTGVTETTGKRSIFETLYQLEDALNNNQSVDRYISDLQSAIEHISVQRTKIGARLNALDQQSEANVGAKLSYETQLSTEQNLDYLEAVGRFNQQMIALQAAQQAYAKMQGLSLFNYIR